MADVTPVIVALDELPRVGGARRFTGEEHGGVPVSIILIEAAPGSPPTGLHRHPYPEVWVIEAGVARFTVGGRELEVSEGYIVIGPAEVPHRFRNGGPRPLRIISIHPAARFVIQDVPG
jgi:mannose-6-phosphate isomerase-like protein (cupin superfamily)